MSGHEADEAVAQWFMQLWQGITDLVMFIGDSWTAKIVLFIIIAVIIGGVLEMRENDRRDREFWEKYRAAINPGDTK